MKLTTLTVAVNNNTTTSAWLNQLWAIIVLFSMVTMPVSAEIFRCMDANGQASFSNTPCPDEAVIGNSAAHTLWRDMRGFVREGQNISSLLGADVKSIIQCQKQSAQFTKELDATEKKLTKLSKMKHKPLYKAMYFLRLCGECRVSAAYDCKKATVQLDEEMKILMEIDRKKINQNKKR